MTNPNLKTLLLIPTAGERSRLVDQLNKVDFDFSGVEVRLCGFGPIAAGAVASRLIHQLQPSRVALAGIAGAYQDPSIASPLTIGRAYQFDCVGSYGVGAGSGDDFQTATQMGWPQLKLNADTTQEFTESIEIGDRLPLQKPQSKSVSGQQAGMLLTCCAASSGISDVARRLAIFPDAVAEDMEAFAVAVSCAIADVPLTVVRGISNTAGDRDKSRWQIAEALDSAANLVADVLSTK